MFDSRRKTLDPGRVTNLVIAQDFLSRRKNTQLYRLCEKCPSQQNKSGGSKYKISCEKHNGDKANSPENTPTKRSDVENLSTPNVQESSADDVRS